MTMMNSNIDFKPDFSHKQHYQLLRRDMPAFIGKSFNTTEPTYYLPNWHIDLMCEYLKATLTGECKRLIINIPPGYTKSVAVNVAYSAYAMGIDPSHRILSASHTFDLAKQMSNKTKQVLESDWYAETFPNTILLRDKENRQDFYKTTENGFRQIVSVGGKVTGKGGNIHIIDDPIDAQDADKHSGIAIRKVNDWFDNTFYSRLRDKKNGVIIIIMQRLHHMDLTGHLLASKLDTYEHCCIPAIEDHRDGKLYAFGNFAKWRREGNMLCEKIEGKVELDKAKERLGTIGFAGQYQQRPTPKSGGMFHKAWFKRYNPDKEEPFFDRIEQSWDTAQKAGELNDYSVCTTWGITNNQYYLLHVLRRKMEYPTLKAVAKEHAVVWEADKLIIEDKSSGQALIQDLRRETTLPIVAEMPVTDKVTRAAAISALIEAGKVVLPTHAPWLKDFETELFGFPLAPYDDQIDSMTQFLKRANKPKSEYRIRQL